MMKAFWALGTLLILAGLLTLIHPDLTYSTRKEWINVGPYRAQVETRRHVHFPRLLGGATVVAGIILLAAGKSSRPG